MEKRESFFNKAEIAGFLMYFVILFFERLLALIFSVNRGDEYSLLSGNAFTPADRRRGRRPG